MKKGQAAIEFMFTYGWAILALVLVTSLLLSTSFFSPSVIVGEECNFGNNLPCRALLVSDGTTAVLSVQMFNSFPYKVSLNSFSVLPSTYERRLDLMPSDSRTLPLNMSSGSNQTFTATFPSTLVAGSAERFFGNLTYSICASELGEQCSTHSNLISGRITSKVVSP
ncbi:hypothetical protein HY990_02210 [Candidatus Micrarchaeota archaeon]|nr:hypothetical protein [Candidatus Micrarchaeota archaeon]